MLVEGVITLIIVAALFYVAPGVLNSVNTAAPLVPAASPLNASQISIGTTAAGALNLSSIGLIMLGIGIMIGGFALIKGWGR
jgi:hypothetical protein